MEKGYIQVYTGNGKGKTTCAIGQGIRASGENLRVLLIQFLKSWNTGELNIIKNIDNFDYIRIGEPRDFTWNLSDDEKKQLKEEINIKFNHIYDIFNEGKYDVIILDEVLGTLNENFLQENDIIDLMNKKPETIELIITGRNASKAIIDRADLVTEMKEVKHYYLKGVNARKGIEY